MKVITAKTITESVAHACLKAGYVLPADVMRALQAARARERTARAKKLLTGIIENASVAAARQLAICQDTGMPAVFVELGQEVRVKGGLVASINKGVEEGYRRGSLRESVVPDPLARGRPRFSPCVIHIDVVKGKKLTLTVLPKGFGCENKSALKMFTPTAPLSAIKDFVIAAVKYAGPDACPPYVVGVGIGGTADYASLLAKKALLRPLTVRSRQSGVRRVERDLLARINRLNIGPMGLGGKTTALAVHIETYPTHIAGLPVAVSLSCHALRRARVIL